MATESLTRGAGEIASSKIQVFDPTVWLAQFQAVGGGHVLADSGLSLLCQFEGRSAKDHREARRMMADLTKADRVVLIDHLRARRETGEAMS